MDGEYKSRTQKKKEDRALQKMGERLVTLSSNQLEQIGLEEELLEAVLAARKTKSHGARRRQFQYIGALIRDMDHAPIQRALENIRFGDVQKARVYRKIETWRDEIKTGKLLILEEIIGSCPDADRQTLTQLAKSAYQSAETETGTKSSKALFRYLKKISGL